MSELLGLFNYRVSRKVHRRYDERGAKAANQIMEPQTNEMAPRDRSTGADLELHEAKVIRSRDEASKKTIWGRI